MKNKRRLIKSIIWRIENDKNKKAIRSFLGSIKMSVWIGSNIFRNLAYQNNSFESKICKQHVAVFRMQNVVEKCRVLKIAVYCVTDRSGSQHSLLGNVSESERSHRHSILWVGWGYLGKGSFVYELLYLQIWSMLFNTWKNEICFGRGSFCDGTWKVMMVGASNVCLLDMSSRLVHPSFSFLIDWL